MTRDRGHLSASLGGLALAGDFLPVDLAGEAVFLEERAGDDLDAAFLGARAGDLDADLFLLRRGEDGKSLSLSELH